MKKAIPAAVQACFMNNGQACISGSRLLVPEHKLEQVKPLVKAAVAAIKVGDPRNPDNTLGPLLNQKQFERVQRYIQIGMDEGAELIAGGVGKPEDSNPVTSSSRPYSRMSPIT
ncbi:aldehyde dehydrogenase family protein [Duganella sp. BuS-21]|uniref:aldehyde dehydrogenase family protein n=1 Tax=Duganella sp. BuS-21 TaxID=2943848 RepID=UPI0035A5FFA1